MGEMIERVAKAIRESEQYWWNRPDEPEEGLAETLACVAIEAMDLWACTGCGCMKSIEQIRTEHPEAISCCPERKMATLTK